MKRTDISKERKKEIDKILIETERKILSGEIKTHSLKEFKQKQEQKRKELQRRQGTSDE